jgi:hypothetical protein
MDGATMTDLDAWFLAVWLSGNPRDLRYLRWRLVGS